MSELHVVFGSGPLGRSVMEELARRGKTVRAVNGSGKAAEIPQGIELTGGSLYDPAVVRDLTRGAAVAYQCAQPHYWEWPRKFPPLQAAIIEGLSGSGTRLVIAENCYAYGDTDGRPLTEDLPLAAASRKGRVRAAMAEAALAAHRAGKVPVTIGRGSDFFGPWVLESAFGERVFRPALAGKAASFAGSLDLPHTATYIGDFGRALVVLGERDEALGRAWHVPGDRPQFTQREFAELICREAGHPVKAGAIGKTMMALAGLFIPGARETVEMMYEFEKPFVVDSSRFERAFGLWATPMEEAIRATLSWYRQHPAAGARSRPRNAPRGPGSAGA
jgi:nucleoside-diphosphate-sugar epimerase